jgi:hypothetical protein
MISLLNQTYDIDSIADNTLIEDIYEAINSTGVDGGYFRVEILHIDGDVEYE